MPLEAFLDLLPAIALTPIRAASGESGSDRL